MSVGEIVYKTAEEADLIRVSSLLVGKTLAEVAGHIKPGISTAELDKIAESFIRDHGAEPSFKGYHGYKNSLCISINEEVVHGIPGARIVQDGDVVSVDCGVFMNGFHGDSAYTFPVGSVNETILNLLRVTKTSLYKGIEKAKNGNRVGDISAAIQEYAESFGFSVVRDFVGHGISNIFHTAPDVPHYGIRGRGKKLRAGMVFTIEPMINEGTHEAEMLNDGWTAVTSDRLLSAQFEHTIAVTEDGVEILTLPENL
jgi:methionyl aminopeptidase